MTRPPTLLTQALRTQRHRRVRRWRVRVAWGALWLGGIGLGWWLAAWVG